MRKIGWVLAGATALLVAAGCSDRSVTEGGRGMKPGISSRTKDLSVSGAVFTSTNPAQDPNTASSSKHDLCLNAVDASPAIDCNIYTSKDYVWLTGGPGPSHLDEGDYVFAVVVPGGQNDPNDGAENNLSDITPTSNTPGGDAWTNRVFHVNADGSISYSGTHTFQNGMIQLMPYDNTTNPGGEYAMAVCSLEGADATATNQPGVDPSLCKYDNFKVKLAECTTDCGFNPQGSSIVTEVHLADHTVINGSSTVYLGAFSSVTVHDKATVTLTGIGGDLPSGSSIDFYFFKNGSCTGTPFAGPDSHDVSGTSPVSFDGGLPETISAPGSYSYKAFFYSGDLTAVTDAEGDCEPFVITAQLGKTMGFWGNTNGIAYITGHGGYAGNALGIGRGSNIDTQAEALKVLPNTLNACGSGIPSIYTVGAATTTNPLRNCTLATGINIGTFNTNASQLLALGYNIKLVTNFTGQSISALGCSAYLTAGLTGASTVNAVFTAAVGLVNGSNTGGLTTQGNLGAMNLLLNCLNRES